MLQYEIIFFFLALIAHMTVASLFTLGIEKKPIKKKKKKKMVLKRRNHKIPLGILLSNILWSSRRKEIVSFFKGDVHWTLWFHPGGSVN